MNEKVVSIYSRHKSYVVKCASLEEACAAASIVRRSGVRVEIIQIDDKRFILELAA